MTHIETLTRYTDEAAVTAGWHCGVGYGLVYTALGLAGEAGEFAGAVSKLMRDNNLDTDTILHETLTEDQRIHLLSELGDVLWYVTMAARELDFDLEDVANYNINKLRDRQKRGVLGGSGDNR